MLFFAGFLCVFFSSDASEQKVVVPATASGEIFEPWKKDGKDFGAPECRFSNMSIVYKSSLCNHFALSRLAVSAASRAIARASECALEAETDCILAPEIGFAAPAAFIYDASEGLRMIMAPRIISAHGEKSIKLNDPWDETPPKIQKFNTTITVEFLGGGSRHPQTEEFEETLAFCIQLLRGSFEDACWMELD